MASKRLLAARSLCRGGCQPCTQPCRGVQAGSAQRRPDWPQVWGGATDAAEGAETGAVARMHSALIAVVAHLLTRLGAQALSESQVRRFRSPC